VKTHTHKCYLLWSTSSINFFYDRCINHMWFQASTTKQMGTDLLRIIVQPVAVIPYQHFRTTYQSYNVGKELTLHMV